MTRYKLEIEYDGRNYVGFQRQDNGPSIQAALETAICGYAQAETRVTAAGRTDAGVHAKAMSVHADIARNDAPNAVRGAINYHLRAHSIAVLSAEVVSPDFNARFDCVQRDYGYKIINRRAPLTFDTGLAWLVPQPMDVEAMRAGAAHLIGKHDFTTFRHVHCQAKSPLRTLDHLDVARDGDEVWVTASARSFLHSQVRSMVGCLALVGRGKWQPEDMKTALEARDRAALGHNAPPDGLYFLKAHYLSGGLEQGVGQDLKDEEAEYEIEQDDRQDRPDGDV